MLLNNANIGNSELFGKFTPNFLANLLRTFTLKEFVLDIVENLVTIVKFNE